MNRNGKVQEAMNHILECEPDTPLEAIQEEIGQVANAILFEDQATVKNLLQELNEVSHPFSDGSIDGESVVVSPTYQAFINHRVKTLSELLGIELERGY
ncbi:hypothetical protein [Enterococcus sp. AZ196]|uniref:hypothetical protein n=1 Tax=Enterococcus sp. AZ196 TaxID=2774659 RepID=UPI003D2E0B92